MSNGFDAYHKWLSIPPHDQPPNHYRLLGLGLFESDLDVVAAAADRQMAHVQTYKTGPHSDLSQKLLNEISAAKLCLLRPQKKAAYDALLRQQLGAAASGFGAVGAAAAVPPNPAAIANSDPPTGDAFQNRSAPGGGSAVAGMTSGMTYSGRLNMPVAPPPPALPPPVADAPPQPLLGTIAILVAAGVVAVLLLIGIFLILSRRNDRSPSSSAVEKTDRSASAATPSRSAIPPATGPQPLPAQNRAPNGPNSPVASVPGRTGPSQTAPPQSTPSDASAKVKTAVAPGNAGPAPPRKSSASPAPTDQGKKPLVNAPSGDVAATAPSGFHPPDKTLAEKNNPVKPPPNTTAPIPPPLNSALAGKAAVPSPAAIAAVEQRLGNMPETSAADLLDQAHKAAEATEIYVLLKHALDAAVKQGDAAGAISILDELVRRFAVNSLEVRLQAFANLQAHVHASASLTALADAAAGSIDEAVAAGQPDSVQRLEETSLTAARQSGNVELIRRITLRILRLRSPSAPVPSPKSPATVPSP